MQKILTLLIVLSASLVPVHAASPLPGKKFIYKQSGGKDQALEIFFPPNHDPAKSKVPGVILFHGGGWRAGGLEQFRYACEYFASRGLVAATANYRTTPKKSADELMAGEVKRICITDAKSAIRWMKQHAAELGMDPQRIITGGGSAGGHISVLATTNPGLNDPADPKDVDASVVAYVLFNPAFGGVGDSDDPEVDVLKQIKADFPPAIAFFGTGDGWKTGWLALLKQLKSLGASARTETWYAEKESHGYWDKPEWNDLNLIEADRFLASLGLLAGEPTIKPVAGSEKKLVKPEE
jgi:acetyl esterase/lipase